MSDIEKKDLDLTSLQKMFQEDTKSEPAVKIIGSDWFDGQTEADYTETAVEDTVVEEAPEEVIEEEPVVTESNLTPLQEAMLRKKQGTMGMEVDNDSLKEEEQPKVGDLSPEVMENVSNYVKEMDGQIEALASYKEAIITVLSEKGVSFDGLDNSEMKALVKNIRQYLVNNGFNVEDLESIKNADIDLSMFNNMADAQVLAPSAKPETPEVKKPKKDDDIVDKSDEEFDKKYSEAVVLIDKINMGAVINFTPDEREKLERSRVIKLKEIEVTELETIKVKKVKSNTPVEKLLKRSKVAFSTVVACVGSGYTATIGGASPYEIIEILRNGETDEDALMINKWRLIYEKIESISIGKPVGEDGFEKWLSITAAADYTILLYGLLVATYPEDDTMTFSCSTPQCAKDKFAFDHVYSTKSLLRAERMSEEFRKKFELTIDNRLSELSARNYHENQSPINNIRRFKFPESGIILDMAPQSAYDFIYGSLQSIMKDLDPKYSTAALISMNVRKAYIPDLEAGLDEDGDYEYFEVSSVEDIVKTIWELPNKDLMVATKLNSDIVADITFDFGLMNIECPRCHNKTLTYDIDLDRILFQRLQRATDIVIE